MKNIVLVTLDATRKDVFGCYGSNKGLTPTFDSLASQSLLFTNAQATGPYTQASFPGILTSSFYLEYGQPKGLTPQRTLISEPLHEAGIVTAAFHSNPYLCSYLGWNRGWDMFYDSMQEDVDARIPYIRGARVNRKAIDWLSSYVKSATGKPFFLWLHYMDVHEPYMPEPALVEIVDPSLTLTQDEMYQLFTDVLLKRDGAQPAQVETLRRLYEVHVREIDGYFAEFLDCLDRLGLLSDTTILVTNDHGDEFGEHGGLSHDNKMYSELIDMPLVVCGTDEVGVCSRVVSSIDIPPTIVNLFDLPAVQGFEGQSLVPSRHFEELGAFGEAMDQRSKEGGDIDQDVYFYREGNLKIIHRPQSEEWEMYDLAADPQERRNIIETSSDAEKLKARLFPRVRRWSR